MILRGLTLSPERCMLEPPEERHADTLSRAEGALSKVGSDPAHLSGISGNEAQAPAPALSASATPLSVEAVTDWLVTCNEQSRFAVASALTREQQSLRQAASEEGRTEGLARGMREAEVQQARVLSMLEVLAREANAAFIQQAAALSSQCAEIVAEAFAKLAGTALVTSDAVLGCVREVVQRVQDEREICIRVNEADLATLQAVEGELARALVGYRFTLVADPRVDLGGCLVETRRGSLDGRLEIQLRSLFETLRAARVSGEALR